MIRSAIYRSRLSPLDSPPSSRTRRLMTVAGLSIALITAGCAEEEEPQFQPIGSPGALQSSVPYSAAPVAQAGANRGPLSFFRKFKSGSDVDERAIRAPLEPLISIEDEGTGTFSINLVDVPVAQAAQAVLGETLRLPFAVAPDAEGMVTLLATQPLSALELLEAFQGALSLNGLALTQSNGSYIVTRGQFVTQRVRRFSGDGVAANVVYAFPLEFVSVNEILGILEPLASQSTTLLPIPSRNLLLVSGAGSDIQAIADTVNVFDVNSFAGKSVTMVSGLTFDPLDIVADLNAIFESGQGQARDGVISFVPNQTLNSILIISSNQSLINEAESWIRNYSAADGEGQVPVVYPLNNRTATELAPILDELLASGALSDDGVGAGTATARGARIIADDAGNSILAYANKNEHQNLSRIIQQMDSVANQVLIEATIAEITLNDELQFGVRAFFESGNWQVGFNGIGSSGLNPAPVSPGFNAIFSTSSASVALNALQSVTDVEIVSTPSLLVLDNKEAELNVGSQVPIATRSSQSVTDPNAPIVNEIEQFNTGVNLRIRPRVSSTGRVVLDIRQEVSEAEATDTSGLESPTINQRIVTTSVAVDDGQSLALGGLIQSEKNLRRSKVPLLGDIPVLGAAFRDTNDKESRSELLIIITPRVVRDPASAQRVTDEFRSQLSRTGTLSRGPNPSAQHQVNRIFR